MIGFPGCYPNPYALKMMQRLATHPNVGAVLLVSLGCEGFNKRSVEKLVRESGRPVKILTIQENGGTRRLPEAAQLAARWNIRVYAIGIRPMPDKEHDENAAYSLDTLAAATNGMSVTATDTAGLRRFFATIDRLEPNTIPSTGLRGGFDATIPALLLAFAAICSETLLRESWMRVIP